jgi:hypothetical protein
LAGEITIYLVGGLEHVLFDHSVGNFIILTDELHHFSGVVYHQAVIYGTYI